MPKLDLTTAKRIKVASGEVTRLKGVGFEWVKPPSESPLQQAVIAAWDMQEESGPLLPAKGGLEIPAFNSPGFTPNRFPPLGARDSASDASQYFQSEDAALTDLFSLNQEKTVRFWIEATNTDGVNRTIVACNGGPRSSPTSGWFFATTQTDWRLRVVTSAGIFEVVVPGEPGPTRVEIYNDAANSRFVLRLSFLDVPANDSVTNLPYTGNPTLAPLVELSGNREGSYWGPLIIVPRALTTDERTADLTPRLYSQL